MDELGDIEFEIGAVEDRIDQAKQDSAQAEGAINAHVERLQNDIGLTSEKEIEDYIDKGEKELAEEKQSIIESFKAVRDMYDRHVQ